MADYDDIMLFLAECIRIFTTWQAISFKRTFYLNWITIFNVRWSAIGNISVLRLKPIQHDQNQTMLIN